MDDIAMAVHEAEIHELQASCAALRSEIADGHNKIATLTVERDRARDAGESLRAELKRVHDNSEAALADRDKGSAVDLGVHLETMCTRLEAKDKVSVDAVVGALRCLGRLLSEANAKVRRCDKALEKIIATEPGSKGAYAKLVQAVTIAKEASRSLGAEHASKAKSGRDAKDNQQPETSNH